MFTKVIISTFIILIYSMSSIAQEGVISNFFKPFWIDLNGEVDSLFQVAYETYEEEPTPTSYKDYTFDQKGNITSYVSQEYGSPVSLFVSTSYVNNKITREIIEMSYSPMDSNLFEYDKKGHLVSIKNQEYAISISYDDHHRKTKVDYSYVSDGYVYQSESYTYINDHTYSMSESYEGETFATSEFKDGKKVLYILNNPLGGSDMTTYEYNKNGDVKEIHLTGPNNLDLLIKTEYEYDDRGNWIKYTERYYNPNEEPYSSGYTTRKLIYKDGHSTGYDVQY